MKNILISYYIKESSGKQVQEQSGKKLRNLGFLALILLSTDFLTLDNLYLPCALSDFFRSQFGISVIPSLP